ncbi:MAG: molybdopterin-dependent oxidoreductase [Chloroflexota bacterium]
MAIGQSIYKVDAPGKVTGQAHFPADIRHDAMLHGRVMFSGRPHARMIAMDTTAAEAIPGVVAILTAKDVPVNEYGLTVFDQPVLVGVGSDMVGSDLSLWEGDQVAIIVAESEQIAQEAMARIEVTWQDLPVVTDPVVAMRDEQILNPKFDSNIRQHYQIRKGDMEGGWAAAQTIVEGTYYLPHQEHAFLQPEAGVGYIDDSGRVAVVIAGQWTHEDQEQIAHALDIPLEQVRVKYVAIGGAFGGREDMSLQIVLALAAKHVHERGIDRPVRIAWSREESIVGHHKRHQGVIHTKWGADAEGIITAVQTEVIFDAGAYNYTSNKVLGNAHLMVSGPYVIPNAKIDSYAVYTNNVPAGAFRGFGGPQGAFAAENQMNKLAAALGIDPVEIRLKNALRDGALSVVQTPFPKGVSITEVIVNCAREADWTPTRGVSGEDVADSPKLDETRSFRTVTADPGTIKRGRGFACAFKNVGFSFGAPERCEATIRLHGGAEIERVELYHAAAEVGQGTHTVLQQMAATALGVAVEKVQLIASDTATTGDSGSVSASRMTFMAGNAIRGAAEKALEAWQDEDRPAEGHYRYEPPRTSAYDPETGYCDPNFSYGYVAEVVDLAVDVETGHIFVERVVCADDVGKAINPTNIEGQAEGAIAQAHGYAITENLQVKDGHILNPRLSTYLIPGILDIPKRVDTIILEEGDQLGPWGARGMAEMPFIPYAPAVTAALYDALGIWFDAIPLTPERVVNVLREHGIGA